MKRLKKVLSLLLVLALVVLTGCQSGDNQTVNDGSTGSTAVTTKDSDNGEKVVTIAVSTLWETFNFLATTSTPTHVVIEEIFDKLMVGNYDGSMSPRLADSWEVNGTTVIFHLNEKAKWHDGTPVTAADVVYTYQVATNANAGWLAGSRVDIAGTDDNGYELSEDSVAVKALDDHTVEITLKAEMDPDLVLTNLNTFVLPAHLLAGYADEEMGKADFWDAPIGSGPFKYDSQIDGERVEYVANKEYHLGAPSFDRLVIRFMNASTIAAGLLNGEVDVSSDISLSDLETLENTEGLTVESVTSTQFQCLIINLEDEAFTAKVRQAIDAAINKQNLVDKLIKGKGEAAVGLLSSAHPYYDANLPDSTYDPELAKQLLAEAGWDFDRVLELTVPQGNQARERSALLIQQDLAAVGIKTEILSLEFATALQNMRDNEYDLLLMGAAGSMDPNGATGTVSYFSHTTDSKFAELAAAGKAGLSFTERKPVYDEYQEYYFQERPLVMLYFSDRIVVYNDRLSNLPIGTSDYWNNKLSWTWQVK